MNSSLNSWKSEFSTINFQGKQHDAMPMCSGIAQDVQLTNDKVWQYLTHRLATWISDALGSGNYDMNIRRTVFTFESYFVGHHHWEQGSLVNVKDADTKHHGLLRRCIFVSIANQWLSVHTRRWRRSIWVLICEIKNVKRLTLFQLIELPESFEIK